MSAAAGWYTDPSGVAGQLRWWDGGRWTEHVTPDPSATPATAEPDATEGPSASAEADVTPEGETTPETPSTPDAQAEAEVQAEPETQAEPQVQAEPEPGATQVARGTAEVTSEPAAIASDAAAVTSEVVAEPAAPPSEPPAAADETRGALPPPLATDLIEPAADTRTTWGDTADRPSWQRDPDAGTTTATAPPDAGTPPWGAHASDPAGDGATASAGPGEPPAPPVAAPAAAWGSGGDAWAGGGPRTWEAPPAPSSGNAVRIGLIVAAVLGVVIVAFVAVLLVRGGSDDVDLSGPVEIGPDTADGGELIVGETVRGTVPSDGELAFELVVETSGPVTIDVRGSAAIDPVAELNDPSGSRIAYDDDRGAQGVDDVGGDHFDPLIEIDLEAGVYRLVVSGFGGGAGDVEVRTS